MYDGRMRGMRLFACAVAVAAASAVASGSACSRKVTAIELDVTFDPAKFPTIDTVYLYLAGPTQATNPMATSATGMPVSTQEFARLDGPADSLAVALAKSPGEVTFAYEPSATDATLGTDIPLVVAVGMSGGSQPSVVAVATLTGVTTIPDRVTIYTMPLQPAGPLSAGQTTAGVRGVEIWGGDDPTNTADRCVRVAPDAMDPASPPYQAIIHDTADPDCDMQGSAKECVPLTYDGALPPGPADGCVTTVHGSGSAQDACRVGAATCIDGAGHRCSAGSDFCAPTTVCDKCEHHPNMPFGTCGADASEFNLDNNNPTSSYTRLECRFLAKQEAAMGASLCSDANLPSELLFGGTPLTIVDFLTATGDVVSAVPFAGGTLEIASGKVTVNNATGSDTIYTIALAQTSNGTPAAGFALPIAASLTLIPQPQNCPSGSAADTICVLAGAAPGSDTAFQECVTGLLPMQ